MEYLIRVSNAAPNIKGPESAESSRERTERLANEEETK